MYLGHFGVGASPTVWVVEFLNPKKAMARNRLLLKI